MRAFIQEHGRTLLWLSLFAVAMGFLEAIVVVYMRELYYPNGFSFPLANIPDRILRAELVREAATLVMLATVGLVAGRGFNRSFAWFLVAFAVWDIVYYVALVVFLDWPASILEWDLLFLIPWAWAGPVLAPVLCSLSMIALGVWVLRVEQVHGTVRIPASAWGLLWLGVLLVLWTFLRDYGALLFANPDPAALLRAVGAYVPPYYPWPVFALGLAVTFGAFPLIARASRPQVAAAPAGAPEPA